MRGNLKQGPSDKKTGRNNTTFGEREKRQKAVDLDLVGFRGEPRAAGRERVYRTDAPKLGGAKENAHKGPSGDGAGHHGTREGGPSEV